MGSFASKVFPAAAAAQDIEPAPPTNKRRDLVRKTVLSELGKDEGVRVLITDGAEFIRAALWELEKELDPGSSEEESDFDPRGNGSSDHKVEAGGVHRRKRRGGGGRRRKRTHPKDLPWPGHGYPSGPDERRDGSGRRHLPNGPNGPLLPMKPEKHMRFREPLNSYIPGAPTSYSHRHDPGSNQHSFNSPRAMRPRRSKPPSASYFAGAMESSSEDGAATEPSQATTSMIDADSTVTTPDDKYLAEMGPGARNASRRRSKPVRRQEEYRNRTRRSAIGATRGRPPRGEFVYEPLAPDEEDWDSASVLSDPMASSGVQEWPPPHGRAAGPSMGTRGGRGRGRARKRDVPMMSGGLPGVVPGPRGSRQPASMRMGTGQLPPGEGYPGEVETDGYRFGYGDGGHSFHGGMMSPGGHLGRGGSRRGRGRRGGGQRPDRRSGENARSSSA